MRIGCTLDVRVIMKCQYSEFFWSVFSRIWTEYGWIRSTSQYSVKMRENKDHINSEYGQFSCSNLISMA